MPTTNVAGKPCWSREGSIGDYGGSLEKEASKTEGVTPYAWFVYRERRAMLGSAYSKRVGGTLVHCQNLASARRSAWVWFRKPEQFRSDALPGTSDQGLPYWATVLKLPTRSSDERWQVRLRAGAHYKAITELNMPSIRTACEELLGAAYVDASFQEGVSLTEPPSLTFWPGVNDGPVSYSLGGGCWMSSRSHLYVELTRPSGTSDADFHQLINVQLFQLLDRLLPAYCTFAASIGGGFLLDISQLDFTGLTEG
jgi:hypothetical protein